MEDTLRERRGNETVTVSSVLILVLMEDTLREKKVRVEDPKAVLILVLMEDTLREIKL